MIFPGPLVSLAHIITICAVQAGAQFLGTYIAQQLLNCLKIKRVLFLWSDPNLSVLYAWFVHLGTRIVIPHSIHGNSLLGYP